MCPFLILHLYNTFSWNMASSFLLSLAYWHTQRIALGKGNMALYGALSWKPVVIVHVQYAVIQHIIQSSHTTHVSNHTEGVQWWVHTTGHTKNRLALLCLSHLIDVHAIVTGQRASRCQVIRTEESGDDAVLVHFSDCGAINKINQPILVHCNACWKQVRGREWRREVQRKKLVITGKKNKNMVDTLHLCLHDSVDRTRWIHVSSLPSHYSGHCKKQSHQ